MHFRLKSKNIGVNIFQSMTIFDGNMNRLLKKSNVYIAEQVKLNRIA